MVYGPLPKTLNTCGPLLINKVLQFCNIMAELFSKRLCLLPPGNRSVDPKGVEGPS